MAIIEGTGQLKTYIGEYDFAIDGGATSTITLRAVNPSAGPIPNGAVIEMGYVDVLTAFTTGSAAQAAINSEGAGDIVAAAVVSGAPWSTTGRKSIIPVGTGASAVKTTAQRSPAITISVGTITAGKAQIVLFYR